MSRLLTALAVEETSTILGVTADGARGVVDTDPCVGLHLEEMAHSSWFECRFCGAAGGIAGTGHADDPDGYDPDADFADEVRRHARLDCVTPRDLTHIETALDAGLPPRSAVRWPAYLRHRASHGQPPITLDQAVDQKHAMLAAATSVVTS